MQEKESKQSRGSMCSVKSRHRYDNHFEEAAWIILMCDWAYLKIESYLNMNNDQIILW